MNKFTTFILASALLTATSPAVLAQSSGGDSSADINQVEQNSGMEIQGYVDKEGPSNTATSDENASGGAKASSDDTAAANADIDQVEANSGMEVEGYVDKEGASADASTVLDTTFAAITPQDSVEVLLWTEIADSDPADASVFAKSENADAAYLEDLRSRVEKNAVIMAALIAKNLNPEDVVDVEAGTDNDVKVYVDDRA